MAAYQLTLTTDELKTIQSLLERDLATVPSPSWLEKPVEHELMQKLILLQLNTEADEPELTPRERAYTLDTRYHPRDSEDERAF